MLLALPAALAPLVIICFQAQTQERGISDLRFVKLAAEKSRPE